MLCQRDDILEMQLYLKVAGDSYVIVTATPKSPVLNPKAEHTKFTPAFCMCDKSQISIYLTARASENFLTVVQRKLDVT